jgi:hypothetical protein
VPDDSGSLTLAELEQARPLVERTIGRELRQAEHVVDVFLLNSALEQAKADLFKAIRAEQRRAVRRAVLSDSKLDMPIHFAFTPAMAAPLDRLRALGKREARAEFARAGYDIPARSMIAEPTPGPEGPHGYVRNEIAALKVKIRKQRVSLEAGGAAQDAILAALYTVPGAMDIASRVVSTALNEGFSSTFSDLAGVVKGWEYSAILDDGTCDECEGHDGEQYATWDDAMEVMPDGGPLPDCAGGGRCRCRIVPLGLA